MNARLHAGDAEPEGFRDLERRPPLDVAQHQHDPVRGGQCVEYPGSCGSATSLLYLEMEGPW
jgi:hypothetical protein